ncbi:alpha/beta fold hydrolase [Microbacterium sp. EYE_512]|nr:alpha/beta fold hydrolase [Microbacterium sp. EYE_512]
MSLGFVIARRLTAPAAGRVYNLSIWGIVRHGDHDAVVLDRTSATATPGVYNLWLEGGGWVRLGPVVARDSRTVTRLVGSVDPMGALGVGRRASWSGIYYRDPADAGLDVEGVVIETPAGPAPAWLVRPPETRGSDWAIHVHGLASPRAGTLRGVQVATEVGFVSLVVTYRNDGEGPTVGAGRSTLGDSEAEDVRAAVRYAVAHGAERIVLFGWSMGAAIALQIAMDHEFTGVLDRLILDSPVLDWYTTIAANCSRVGLPSETGALARPWLECKPLARAVGLRAPIRLRRFDWVSRSASGPVPLPTLILHGTHDSSSPPAAARQLVGKQPETVELEMFSADHTLCWNSDPERWKRRVREWLAEPDAHLEVDASKSPAG